tara:strand:+ start:346 stop:1029 length:684 start_codon:yes stop_codon:yes gene_type:complete
MNIGIIGYGKMGQAVEQVAIDKNHSIIFKINTTNIQELNPQNLSKVDVAIEFSNPKDAFNNITFCLKHQTPIVSGTTGWLNKIEEVKNISKQHNTPFLYSENFSLGVNCFFKLNQIIARLTHTHNYNACINETHHTSKKDKPSGTAIKLANDISKIWNKTIPTPIKSHRKTNIKGEHLVSYSSEIDTIEIKHTAHSRVGFAKGAILASEFIQKKTGFFSMEDVLNNL